MYNFYKNEQYLFFIKMIYNHLDEIMDKYGVLDYIFLRLNEITA
jgi:hypothetical protein